MSNPIAEKIIIGNAPVVKEIITHEIIAIKEKLRIFILPFTRGNEYINKIGIDKTLTIDPPYHIAV